MQNLINPDRRSQMVQMEKALRYVGRTLVTEDVPSPAAIEVAASPMQV